MSKRARVWVGVGLVAAVVAAWAFVVSREEARARVAVARLADEAHATEPDGESRPASRSQLRTIASPFDPSADPANAPVKTRVILGRLVGPGRFPVVDASVVVTGGDQSVTTTSDAAGAFHVDLPFAATSDDSVTVAVHARAPDSIGAITTSWFNPQIPSPLDLGIIPCAPMLTHVIRVVGDEGTVAHAHVRIAPAPWMTPVLVDATADGHGELSFGWVRSWPWVARVVTRDGRMGVGVPPKEIDEPTSLTVRVGASERITVDVRSDTDDKPVPGTSVSVVMGAEGDPVALSAPAVSDADGRCVFDVFAPRARLSVRAAPPAGWQLPDPAVAEFALGDKRDLTLRLRRHAVPLGMRWPIEHDAATPADGASVVVRHLSSWLLGGKFADARVQGGVLVAPTIPRSGGWSPFAIAVDASGAAARLTQADGHEVGEPIRFAPLCHLVVHVVAENKPVGGADVQLVASAANVALTHPRTTNADGDAIFEALWPDTYAVDIHLPTAARWNRLRADSFTIADGERSKRVAVDLGAPLQVTAHVTVNGARRLPDDFQIDHDRSQTMITDWREDPSSATVTFQLWSQTHDVVPMLEFSSNGMPNVVIRSASDLPWPAGGRLDVAVPFTKGLSITATVIPAPGLSLQLRLNEWPHVDAHAFVYWRSDSSQPPSPDGRLRFTLPDVPPGRYCLVDATTGRRSEVVEIADPNARYELSLDLSGLRPQRGVVVGPRERSVKGALVLVKDAMSEPPRTEDTVTTSVDDDGTFVVPIPVGHESRVSVWHPELRSSPTHGSVTLTGPVDALQLALLAPPRATLTLTGDVPTTTTDASDAEAPRIGSVVLVEPGPKAAAIDTFPLFARGGQAWFEYDEGRTCRIRVHVDGKPLAWIGPVALPDDGTVELGRVKLDPGGRLRIELAPSANVEAESYAVWLSSDDPVQNLLNGYERNVRHDEPVVTFDPVVPGTYFLRITPRLQSPRTPRPSHILTRTITIDSGRETFVRYAP